jgi:hypothetical protein
MLLLPITAEGADWVKASESQNDIWYVDVSSIKQVTSAQYKAWIKMEDLKPKDFKTSKTYTLFDCSERKYKDIQSAYYKTDGNIILNSGKEEWAYVIPESIWENVLNFVCTRAGFLKIPK